MTLRDPIWLLALAIIPLLALLLVYSDARARRRMRQFAAERLLKGLVRGESGWMRWTRFCLASGAMALVILALARPQGGERVEKLSSSGADVLFAVDTSRSMLASDLAPNRLTRAKLAIHEMLDLLPGNRVGLVAFAGAAFLQCPLTLDHGAFQQALEAVDAGIIPTPGTNLAAAIAEAQKALSEGERPKFLILLTDGEDLEAAGLKQAREVEGITIITVGVGTADGALVPASAENPQAGATRDSAGNMVVSKLDPSTLEAIATETGGFYMQLQPGAVEQIYKGAIAGVNGALAEQEIRTPIERYQWPLAAAICLLLLEPLMGLRRRAGVASMILFTLMALPDASWAGGEKDAYALLMQEKYAAAVEAYSELINNGSESAETVYNLGVAQYKSGNFAEAAKTFERSLELGGDVAEKAAYNAGTAYLKAALEVASSADEALPHAEAARKHLETALGQSPQSTQARENLKQAVELLEQLRRQQRQQNQESEQPQDQQGMQGDESKQQEQEQQESPQDSQDQQQTQSEEGRQGEAQQQDQGAGEESSQQEQSESGEQGQQEQAQQQSDSQQGENSGSRERSTGEQGDTQQETGAQQKGGSQEQQEGEARSGSRQEQTNEDPYGHEAEAARGAESGLQGSEEETAMEAASVTEGDVDGEATETLLLTREQAERLLRALQREEKMLPAGKLLEPVNRGEGRDW